MSGFTKLDSGIVDSSLWAEPAETRVVWITLLAKCDKTGYARLSESGLQRASNVPMPAVRIALERFQSPDTDSRTPDNEGRRVEKMAGGWHILNYEKYRADMIEETAKEYLAEKKRKERACKIHSECKDMSRHVSDTSASASASGVGGVGEGDTEQDLEKELRNSTKFKKPTIEAVKERGAVIELPAAECEKFFDYYEANGWRVGRNPMKLWPAALANWKRNWESFGVNNYAKTKSVNPRNIGIATDGTNYGDHAKRKLERQMAQAQNESP